MVHGITSRLADETKCDALLASWSPCKMRCSHSRAFCPLYLCPPCSPANPTATRAPYSIIPTLPPDTFICWPTPDRPRDRVCMREIRSCPMHFPGVASMAWLSRLAAIGFFFFGAPQPLAEQAPITWVGGRSPNLTYDKAHRDDCQGSQKRRQRPDDLFFLILWRRGCPPYIYVIRGLGSGKVIIHWPQRHQALAFSRFTPARRRSPPLPAPRGRTTPASSSALGRISERGKERKL
jgi:hypothetical protein